MTSRPSRIAWNSTRTRVVGVAVVLAAVLGGGIALAYWTAAGSGTGTATTGAPARVTLTPGTPTAELFPGGRADVALVVSNPGTSAVTVATISFDSNLGFTVDAAHAGCDLSVLGFDTQTNSGAGWVVPGRTGGTDGALTVTLPDAMTMAVDAANACQGAQFSVYLVAGR